MRKLLFKDCLALARIMKKANISDQLSDIAEKAKDKNVNMEKVGIKAAIAIFESCGDEQAEKEIYKLLAGVFEEDAENMELNVIVEKFKQLAKENNLIAFFKSASQSIQ